MSRPLRRDRGIASLELIGVLPTLLLCAILAFQVGLAGWGMASTVQAARAAARAASLGHGHAGATQAAQDALPGALVAEAVTGSCYAEACAYSVTVRVPSAFGQFDLGTITRTVEMPKIT